MTEEIESFNDWLSEILIEFYTLLDCYELPPHYLIAVFCVFLKNKWKELHDATG